MSPRKFPVEKEHKPKFQDKKKFKTNVGESKPMSGGGFFIKPAKNKNNHGSEVKSGPGSHKKESFRKKEKLDSETDAVDSKTTKQPFDKKAWRFKRYSKKYKLEQWKNTRKTHMLRGLDKTPKNNDNGQFHSGKDVNFTGDRTQQEPISEDELTQRDSSNDDNESKSIKPDKGFTRNKLNNKRNQILEDAKNKKIEDLKRKAAKDEAIKEYKRKKLEKHKKLNRKTKKGQPIMKDRIEMLLEKIQNSIKN